MSTEAEVSRRIARSIASSACGTCQQSHDGEAVVRSCDTEIAPRRRTARSLTEPKWVEPADTEPSLTDGAGTPLSPLAPRFLPDWARSPVPDRIDGPFVVVRRVVDSSDPSTVPTLHMALDQIHRRHDRVRRRRAFLQ